MKIVLVFGIIFLFIFTAITPSIAIDTIKNSSMPSSNGKTLYVGGGSPGNYSRIQDALDNASNGDTIYVYNGTYNEFITINKSLNLIGESKDNVIVKGTDTDRVVIKSNWINISSITFIQWGSHYGIVTDGYDYINIDNCFMDKGNRHILFKNTENVNIYNSYLGSTGGLSIEIVNAINIDINSCEFGSVDQPIYFDNVSYSIIRNIYAPDCLAGITFINYCSNNFIDNYTHIGNGAANSGVGIFNNCDNNTVSNSSILNQGYGIAIYLECYDTKVFGNKVCDNNYGVYIGAAENNHVYHNNFINNKNYGVYIGAAENNHIFHNNFISNYQNAFDDGTNIWNDSYPSGGNYWNDYTGIDTDDDGIGDTPYDIPGDSNQDQFPLMNRFGPPYAEFTYDNKTSVFNASISGDYNGDIVSYEWDFGDGTTGHGEILYHKYCENETYKVKLTVTDDDEWKDSITKSVEVIVANTPPILAIFGSNSGKPEKEYEYVFYVIDPDLDDFFLWVDWGDGNLTGWIGPYIGGVSAKLIHIWNWTGTYVIKAKVKDDCDESELGYLTVQIIPRSRATIYSLFQMLFDKLSLLERLLNLLV